MVAVLAGLKGRVNHSLWTKKILPEEGVAEACITVALSGVTSKTGMFDSGSSSGLPEVSRNLSEEVSLSVRSDTVSCVYVDSV